MPVATSIASAAGGVCAGCHGLRHRRLQRLRQHLARGQQALQRVADQRELLAQPARRCCSPPATADQASLAAATRLRACDTIAGSKRPRAAAS